MNGRYKVHFFFFFSLDPCAWAVQQTAEFLQQKVAVVPVCRRVVDLEGEGEGHVFPLFLILPPHKHRPQEHPIGLGVEGHVGIGEPGHAGEKNGVLPAHSAGPLLLKAVQIVCHGPVKGWKVGVIFRVQTVHAVGDRVQNGVFRVYQVIVAQLPL